LAAHRAVLVIEFELRLARIVVVVVVVAIPWLLGCNSDNGVKQEEVDDGEERRKASTPYLVAIGEPINRTNKKIIIVLVVVVVEFAI